MIEVLLVEDEPEHAELVLDTWEVSCDWRIAQHVASLSEALVTLEERNIHAVLLDLNLGDSHGLETLQRLQASALTPAIVVLTSLDNHDLARDAIRTGADDYIPKTQLSTDLLGRTIRHALERNRLTQELRQTNQRLSDFAAFAAHDLVAPLGRVVSMVTLLEEQQTHGLVESPMDVLGLIRDECERLTMLTHNLLLIARTGSESMKFESTALSLCAEQAVESLSLLIQETRAQVRIADLPSAPVDRYRITLLLQNLIENGIKYQKPGNLPVIDIAGANGPTQIRISVRDNGLGIAAEHHATIFESFHRLHGEENPGTGLGLAHCAQIVHDHGGTIGVDSAPDKGSLFWFTIPTQR